MVAIKYNITIICFGLFCILSIVACKKYLEKKPDQQLTVPTTVKDFQALLDASDNYDRDVSAGEASADNYYLNTSGLNTILDFQKQLYVWGKDYQFPPGLNSDWTNPYQTIYLANVVLSEVDKIQVKPNNYIELNNLKGHAYFLRAKSYQQLAFQFALAFDSATSSSDLGLPLRLNPDFNLPSVRSSIKDTYNQIIADFKSAIEYLPISPIHPVRPGKPAAYAFLARTYLAMGAYDSCFRYSDLCLQLKSDLLDFNTDVLTSGTYLIARHNKEVLVDGIASSSTSFMMGPSYAVVDSVLYSLYSNNDKRKTVFFLANTGSAAGTYRFRGSYTGAGSLFTGIGLDEVYLMRAESNVRKGNTSLALDDLNALLKKRHDATFIPFQTNNAAIALEKILIERRKELLFRNLRWIDIKRLNKRNAGITLTRIVNGQTFTLLPNSPRYALAIPEDVIAISGMQQNPR